MSRLQPSRLFLILSGSSAFLRNTIYLGLSVYYVLVVHMNALQLVLAGTALELSYFLWQTPTGVVADVFGRRRAVVAGWAIAGGCFVLEGLSPTVFAVLTGQAILGLAEAFIDGSTEAWLADEVGQDRFGAAVLRGSQIGQIMTIAGIVLAVPLGSVRLALPIVAGGLGMMAMSVFFAFAMPEAGFRPAVHEHGSPWRAVRGTLGGGARLIRGNPTLLTILGVELFVGGGSEGFDRLWQAHLIRDIHLPRVASLGPIVWFALLAVAGSVVALGVNRALEPHLTRITAGPRTMGRLLAVLNAGFVAATVGFALANNFVLATVCLLLRAAIGAPSYTITAVWYNQNITDSSVRATVLSMTGQVNALGQWIGGPVVGLLGNATSLASALTATALVRSPITLLCTLAGRRPAAVAAVPEGEVAAG